MNPNNHFSNFNPQRTYFPNPNPQSFPPPQNQTLIIPPNFPQNLLPSLQKYLSTSTHQLYQPMVPSGSLHPGVMQYPSIVSPLRLKPFQSGIQVQFGSGVLLPASAGGSPYLSRISQGNNTFGNHRFDIRPASAQLNNAKNEKIKNEKIEDPNDLSKKKKNPLPTQNKISEVEKTRISEKNNKITSQENIIKNQEQRLEKGFSIFSEEQKKEEVMGSCLSFAELEQMKLKHQGTQDQKDKILQLYLKRHAHNATRHHHHNKNYNEELELPLFQEFLQLYQQAEASGQNFIDPDFKPNIWSLIEPKGSDRKEKWAKLTWGRPKDFLQGNYYIFHSDSEELQGKTLASIRHRNLVQDHGHVAAIDIDDIVQGQLGDCYFLSSLSSIAENPFRIRSLFISKKVNEKAGIYCVKICFEGVWRAVYVDDFFPINEDGSGPCFSTSKKGDNELWVLILEKAWAKLYGNYERIEAGLTREVLRSLTGAPTKIVWTDDPNLWDDLLNGEAKDFIMTAGAVSAQTMENVKMHEGMVVGHAYSLISASEVMGVQLVKLRNPWGSGEWKGAWSDEDPRWDSISAEKKKEIGYDDEDDGCFFMDLEDFKIIYDTVQICMVEDENVYDSLPFKAKSGKAVYLEVDIPKDGDYCFTILQPSTRIINLKDYDYGMVHLVVAKREGEDLVFVGARQTSQIENSVYCRQMKPGKYVIYSKVQLQGIKEGRFVLSSYGDHNVSIKIIPKEQKFLEKVYLTKAVNSEKKYEFFQKEGFGYLCLENKTEKTKKIKVTFKKMVGIKLKKKNKGNSCEVIVNGKSKNVVILKLEGDHFDIDIDEEIFE